MCGSCQSKERPELKPVEKEKFLNLQQEKEESDPFTAARKTHGNRDYAFITTPGQNFDPVIEKINVEKYYQRIPGSRIYKSKKIPFSHEIIEVYIDINLKEKNQKKEGKCKFVNFQSEKTHEQKLNKNTLDKEKKLKIRKQKISTIHKIFENPPEESPIPNQQNNKSGLYKDPKFPPKTSSIIQRSLYDTNNRLMITSQTDKRLIMAVRYIDSFFWSSPLTSPINFKIFDDKPLENSIHQGLFLNDYFLAALGALACHDYRLGKKLVSAGGKENMEYVGISFNKQGRWECIWVDSFLPFFKKEYKFKSRSDMLYFRTKFLGAQCKENEIWVPLYEKAYAKLMGSYFNIAYGGLAGHVMTDLTGAPSLIKKISEFQSPEEVWEKLVKSYQLGYMICCDSVSSDKAITLYNEEYQAYKQKKKKVKEGASSKYFMKKGLGLVDQHTYSLTGIAVIKGNKLIKLRNVWGRTEWLGKWGDGSKEWLDKQARGLEHKHANDGVFYIPFEDFMKLFERVHICHCEDEYVFSNCQVDVGRTGEMYCFDVEVKKKGLYFFSFSQESHQKYPLEKTINRVNYAPLTLVCVSDNGIFHNIVSGRKEAERDVWIKADFSPGTYRFYVIISNFINSKIEFFLIFLIFFR